MKSKLHLCTVALLGIMLFSCQKMNLRGGGGTSVGGSGGGGGRSPSVGSGSSGNFDNAMKECAIDCELNKNANVYPELGEEIKCDI